jgi:bifunctional non-homologous end joining protein LigD
LQQYRRKRDFGKTNPTQSSVVAGIEITHPGRMLYPEAKVTKLDVARYYEAIAPRMLPYIRRRPISVVRCPDGPGGTCFFQKHATARAIPGIDTTLITESGGRRPYIVANTVEALVGLAQMNALELHAWGAMAGAIERPDTLILDLDPDPALEWSKVVAGARLTRALLDELGLESLVKTTGGKGLHVVVPLQPRHGWDEVRSFAQSIADHLARTLPEQFTATMAKTRRRGKIFVDYLRNGRGATAVAPYSLRARPGATVATPLAWEELTPRLRPAAFNLASVLRRVERENDPWAGYDKLRQRLTALMRRALKT